MSAAIRRVLLDVLKPREVSLIELSKATVSLDGVDEVEAIVSEVDSKTETIKITLKGQRINYDLVSKAMDRYGVSMRGIDEISVSHAKPKSEQRSR
jgi:hypothetical protein